MGGPSNKPGPGSGSDSQPAAATAEPVVLPPNVSIYSGPAHQRLLGATLFTRLATTLGADNGDRLGSALKGNDGAEDLAAFCHVHQHNVVLIFDGAPQPQEHQRQPGGDPEDEADAHHEHFRAVCLRLKDSDISLDYGACRFDVRTSLEAGFQTEGLSGDAVLLVDLMEQGQDSDDDDDDDSEGDADFDFAAAGLEGGTVETDLQT